MVKLNNETMQSITGGGIKWGTIAGIGALASFIFGIIDGLVNPQKCNN